MRNSQLASFSSSGHMPNNRPQPEPSGEVTRVLASLQSGDRQSTDQLLALVYDELRRLARARLAGEANAGAGMTLQATALVHEAYLRLLGAAKEKVAQDESAPAPAEAASPQRPVWDNRGHFFAAAALAMRRILVERARHQKRLKHGGGKQRLDLDDQRDALAATSGDYDGTDLVALDEAIKKLEAIDARKARIVSLRYFAGLTVHETAAALDLSPATVKNEWAFARAWLHRELSGENAHDADDSEPNDLDAPDAEGASG
jgi:RNA polymerase sigma factor (sigma-70 family)